MDEPKKNKSFEPAANKALVKIKFRPGRAAEGVAVDEEGCAFVDEDTAAYLVKINYADKAEEK